MTIKKIHVLLFLMLALALCIGFFPSSVLADDTTGDSNEAIDLTFDASFDSGGYYYDQLKETEKALYQIMAPMKWESGKFLVNIPSGMNGDELTSSVQKALTALQADDPRHHMYWDRYSRCTPVNSECLQVKLVRMPCATEYLISKSNARISDIVSRIDPNADVYTKVRCISMILDRETYYSDLIYDNGSYEGGSRLSALNDSATGIFAYNSAVCAGYADACKILFNELDIDGIVAGNAGHAWNFVHMDDGGWYSFDCSSDGERIDGENLLFGSQTDWFHLEGNPYQISEPYLGSPDWFSLPVLEEGHYVPGAFSYEYTPGESSFQEPDARFVYTDNGDGTCKITGYEGAQSEDLVIPSAIDGLTVTSIGIGAFLNCKGFTGEIVIPDTVLRIEEGAFQGCSGITGGLTLSKNLQYLGNWAFHYCSSMTGSIDMPETLTYLGKGAFCRCSSLTGNLTLADQVEWNPFCFQWTGFSSITASNKNSHYSTVDGVLYNKDQTVLIFCPPNKTGALNIPSTVKEISDEAVRECKISGQLILPEGLEIIGGDAFYNTKFEGDLIIPDSVIEIKPYALCYLRSIPSDGNFGGRLVLGNSLTKIGEYAFEGCTFSGDLEIPENVTSIGKYAFQSCRFAGALTLPESVKSIGEEAFCGCLFAGELKTSNDAKIGKNAFANNRFSYFSCSCGKTYQSTTYDPCGVLYECQNCGGQYFDGEHEFDEWEEYEKWNGYEDETRLRRNCSQCGYQEDINKEIFLKSAEYTSMLGHDLKEHPVIAATCEENGNSAYWSCSRCGRFYSDKDGNTEIKENSWVIDKTGHDWGDWTVTKEPTEEEEGVETRVCKNDSSHTEKRAIDKLPAGDIRINEANFPDELFKNYVSTNFDKNHDNVLNKTEADAVTEIKCGNSDEKDNYTGEDPIYIKDYTGVEYFSNLKTLECGTSVLETLDVTHNQKLEVLDCRYGKLTALDVSQNPELTYLNCDQNNLDSIDVTNNTYLKSLHCFNNDIASLDITQNPDLEDLSCNGSLSELDISNNPKLKYLIVSDNNLAALDLSNAPDLEYLDCIRNKITELDTGGLKKLTFVDVARNQLEELDLGASVNLTEIYCHDNKLQKLTIADQTEELYKLDCSNNELTELDVKGAIHLKTLDCANNQLTHLPLYTLDQLKHLECQGNQIEELNIGASAELINCYENGWFKEKDGIKEYTEKLTEDQEEDGVAPAFISCDSTVTINAAPHEWDSEPTVDKAATCTEKGVQSIHCKTCSERKNIESIPAKGHTEETLPAKAATCTETGLTEGTKCSVCGETLKAQEETPAKGHTEEIVPAKAATCTETGLTEGTKCSVCGETLKVQEEIPAKGHTEETVPAKAATCTETGLTEGTKCSVCGETLKAQEETPAKGHDWGDWTVTKEATEDEEGVETRVCKNDPSHTEERAIDKLPPKPNRYLDESDIFWFENGYAHFGYDDYYINDNDLQKLINNVRQVYAKQPDFAESVINGIRKEQQKTWQGSCYGMAAVTILDKQNAIGFNENFDSSAATMHDVQSPAKNDAVKSAINYYFLGQNVPYVRIKNNNRYDISKSGWSDGLKNLVTMSQDGKPILFSYFWKAADGSLYGHAIVIKGYEKSSNGEHHLIAYDNRIPTRDMDVTISSDYSSCVVNGNEYATSIEYIQNMSAFEAIDIDGPDNKYQSDATSGSTETASETQGTNVTVSANGKVSIQNAEGQKLDIEDGQTSGNMEILDRSMIVTTTDSGEDGSKLCFTVADSKAYTFESDQKEMTASVQSENMYGSAETNGADKITISEKDGISAEGNAYSYDMALSVGGKTCDMVSITGETKEDANLKLVDGKVEATGIDADAGTLTVFSNDINTDNYAYDKGYSSIMIAPSDSEQAGQIDILGSSNNDGNYDVKIGGSSEKKDLSKAVITVPDQAYTGRPIAPEKMVVTIGSIRLEQGKDYRAFYENNMDVGTATVYIIGTGDYIGTAQGTFNIIKAKNPLNIVKKTIKVKAKSLKKKNLTVAPLRVTGAQGGKSFKAVKWNAKAKKALKLNKKTGKITIRKGTRKSTFRVKVQVTAKGNASYLAQKRNVIVTIRVR